jgi:flagellar M-ring protein FliF
VVDSNGKLLSEKKEATAFGTLNADQLEYQARVEKNLENRIKTMLEQTLGPDKAIVRLSCALDFKRQEMTEEKYFPENQVVRSEQLFQEKASEPEVIPEGIPGIASNLPEENPETNIEKSVATTFEKQDRTVNYEIGKTTSHVYEPVGEIKRISVAVVVDGTYQWTEKEEGEFAWEYTPRTSEEIQKLENICKRAVNFDAERGDQVEVVNIPFETTKLGDDRGPGIAENWLSRLKAYSGYFKYAFLVLFILLSYLIVIRPLVRWLTEQSPEELALLSQLPKTVGELESEYEQEAKRLTFRDQASELIARDNETSLSVMRDWLQEK